MPGATYSTGDAACQAEITALQASFGSAYSFTFKSPNIGGLPTSAGQSLLCAEEVTLIRTSCAAI